MPQPYVPLPSSTTPEYQYPIPQPDDEDLLTVSMIVDQSIDPATPNFKMTVENDLEVLYFEGLVAFSSQHNPSTRQRRFADLSSNNSTITSDYDATEVLKASRSFRNTLWATIEMFVHLFEGKSEILRRSKRNDDPSSDIEVVVRLFYVSDFVPCLIEF